MRVFSFYFSLAALILSIAIQLILYIFPQIEWDFLEALYFLMFFIMTSIWILVVTVVRENIQVRGDFFSGKFKFGLFNAWHNLFLRGLPAKILVVLGGSLLCLITNLIVYWFRSKNYFDIEDSALFEKEIAQVISGHYYKHENMVLIIQFSILQFFYSFCVAILYRYRSSGNKS